jgi:hypothetical protein
MDIKFIFFWNPKPETNSGKIRRNLFGFLWLFDSLLYMLEAAHEAA